MQFYLLFPLLIYIFRRRNGPIFLYTLIAISSALAQFAARRYLTPLLAATLPQDQAYLAEAFFYCWLPRQSICFGFGILLYQCIEQRKPSTPGILFLIGACLCSAREDSWAAQIVILFAISFAVLAWNVMMPIMTLLGRHSYGIYLTHFGWASAITALVSLDLIPMFVLVTAASLGGSYYLIEPLFERRFNRLGHLLALRAGRPKTAANAA
jgi:peptidoglycan/LPS O-acetylase OafA/YrhL